MKIGNVFKGDKVIWMVFLLLCTISVVEVFSASSTLTYRTNNYLGPITYHTVMILLSAVAAIVMLSVPYRYYIRAIVPMLFVTYATLIWVLVAGESINGANRIIPIMGITFQPSEIAKGTLVLVTAQILSNMQLPSDKGADPLALRYVLILTLPAILLIAIENLSTACLLFAVIFIMLFLGRIPKMQMGKLLAVIVIAIVGFLTLVFLLGNVESREEAVAQTEQTSGASKDEIKGGGMFHRFATWRSRIQKHLDKTEVPASEYDLDKNMQVAHANIAIVTSNVIGRGPGNSVERDFLPQAFSDFIYAIIIEEMGILGAIVVVALYIFLLFRCMRIAGKCEQYFPAMLVMGLSLMLVLQAVINMLVAVGIAPVTGQPLPLISKGGTSTIINGAYIGMILSISRSVKRKPAPAQA